MRDAGVSKDFQRWGEVTERRAGNHKKALDNAEHAILGDSDGRLRKPVRTFGYAVAPALRVPKARGFKLRDGGERKESGTGRGEARKSSGMEE